jgi:hypothetical protein
VFGIGDLPAESGVFLNVLNKRVGIHNDAPTVAFEVDGNTKINGTLALSGAMSGAFTVPVANITGTLSIAGGGTGATSAGAARINLGLGLLATANTISGLDWSGTDLALADGGTGASNAGAAFNNIAASGGTVGGAIVRSGRGGVAHANDAAMTDPRMFFQAMGADPTSAPGDIVFEW